MELRLCPELQQGFCRVSRITTADRDRAAAELDSLPLISGSPVFNTAASSVHEMSSKALPVEWLARRRKGGGKLPAAALLSDSLAGATHPIGLLLRVLAELQRFELVHVEHAGKSRRLDKVEQGEDGGMGRGGPGRRKVLDRRKRSEALGALNEIKSRTYFMADINASRQKPFVTVLMGNTNAAIKAAKGTKELQDLVDVSLPVVWSHCNVSAEMPHRALGVNTIFGLRNLELIRNELKPDCIRVDVHMI
ncbi:hypothetical protein EYF80_032015 [Liparis tanakae]|uniref:Uncharacterized protein n=1 Tax=Liparis tanakae TaxID=230148 RepID=A0A4Z2GVR4_9TELE|nr:hypothetical protein EYF80_032015 [Liparis tanakae]